MNEVQVDKIDFRIVLLFSFRLYRLWIVSMKKKNFFGWKIGYIINQFKIENHALNAEEITSKIGKSKKNNQKQENNEQMNEKQQAIKFKCQ